MLGWLLKADKGADLVVRWVGLLTVLSGIYTWANTNARWLGKLNLAEAALLGVGMALVTLLAVAVSLALLRYFRPVEQAMGPSGGAEPRPDSEDIGHLLARLEHNQGNLRDKFISVEAIVSLVAKRATLTKRVEVIRNTLEASLPSLHELSALIPKVQEKICRRPSSSAPGLATTALEGAVRPFQNGPLNDPELGNLYRQPNMVITENQNPDWGGPVHIFDPACNVNFIGGLKENEALLRRIHAKWQNELSSLNREIIMLEDQLADQGAKFNVER